MTCGIYKIVNTLNGNTYVGQSSNIEQRFIDHKKNLKKNQHDNPYLQNAWNKYGSESFEFSIIELCSTDQLTILEQFHADTLKEQNVTLYNIGKYFDSPRRGVPLSKNQRQKISNARTGRFTGKDNPFYGKTHTPESLEKMSKTHKGRKTSDETKLKMSNVHRGKKHSDKAKQNMVLAQSGENSSSAKLTWEKVREIRIMLNENVSVIEISKQYGVHPRTIYDIKYNKTWKEQYHIEV